MSHGGENYCADIDDNPFVGEWTVNLGYFLTDNTCNVLKVETYTYYDYYTGEYYYYGAPQGVFSINSDGTFTHSYL